MFRARAILAIFLVLLVVNIILGSTAGILASLFMIVMVFPISISGPMFRRFKWWVIKFTPEWRRCVVLAEESNYIMESVHFTPGQIYFLRKTLGRD